MSTDALAIQAFLRRAWRRRAGLLTLSTAGVAIGVAALLLALARLGWVPTELAIVGGGAGVAAGTIYGLLRARRARERIAYDIERCAPRCRNLLVTAAELIGAPEIDGATSSVPRPGRPRPPAEILRLVESRAAELVLGLDAAALFPLRRPAIYVLVAAAVWLGLVSVPAPAAPPADPAAAVVAAADVAPSIGAVEVMVTPPAYTGGSARRVVDPRRLEVVAGGRLEVRLRAVADAVKLSTLEGSAAMERRDDGVFVAEFVAQTDGFIALEPAIAGRAGARRLIGLVVQPDAPPLVRLTEPGRDLFLPQPEVEVAIAATARDDFGLDELRFTYTIVSGSGETFEFTEGELPARLAREDERSWSADAVLSPAALGLSLGDMVVYRAVARDRRPDAPEVESDAFVVEIVGRDAAVAGGFALESDEEREALSQRMIIIKTEQLLAQRGSMSAEDFRAEARRIAAEQRIVRAEFVFMMGGEVQDEVEEAAHEHEVAAGRLELRGRQEMSRAVQFMSRAAARLTDADLEGALPLEEQALEALQSALARSRYILRTLSDRQTIDLTRRLTAGNGVARGARAAADTVVDPEVVGVRRMLADLAELSAPDALDAAAAGRISALAEAVVRLDPSSDALQAAAAELAAAAAEVGDRVERIGRVMQTLRDHIENRLPLAPAAAGIDADLAGALADELDARGGGR